MVVLAGLPVLVVEAKARGESIENGLAEARARQVFCVNGHAFCDTSLVD